MSKFLRICPKCFSSSVRVKFGSGGFVEDGFLVSADMGEVYSCPGCDFVGPDIIQGNEVLLGFLKHQKLCSGELSQKKLEQASALAKIK